MTDIAIIACVVVALVLVILRIWEQSRLKKATSRLLRSHSEFDRVLDRVTEYVGIDDDDESVPAAPHGVWYIPEGGRIPGYFICRAHEMPWKLEDIEASEVIGDVWQRGHFDEIEAAAERFGMRVISSDPWTLHDKPEYEPAHR